MNLLASSAVHRRPAVARWCRHALAGTVATVAALVLPGCATLSPNFETPSVKVVSVRTAPPTSGRSEFAPRFEITLRVTNPNPSALGLRGLSYTLSLDGLEVVEGVAANLPKVPAYGEKDIPIEASINLIEGLRFVSGLMDASRSADVTWRLQARLDVGALLPRVNVREEGVLSLGR